MRDVGESDFVIQLTFSLCNAVNINIWTVPEKYGKIDIRGVFLVMEQSKGLKRIYFCSYNGVKKDFHSTYPLTESVKRSLLCSLCE